MVKGIGIDMVEVERFRLWHTYPTQRLRKIFSQEELAYCLSVPKKSAERFAVRFAAKEAFFKAISYTKHQYPLITICKSVSVVVGDEHPRLEVNWDMLRLNPASVHISLSHTKSLATVVVIVGDMRCENV